MYALVDGNNFYVSCERVFRPSLNGRPVIVLSNNDSCAIARSDEAKALGIKMGHPYFKVKKEYPDSGIIALSANFVLYGDLSTRMHALAAPLGVDQDRYSIDESFVSLHGVQGDLKRRGQIIRARVLQCCGIPCGIGIGLTKTLAKLANKIAKDAIRKPGSYPEDLGYVCHLGDIPSSDLDALLAATPAGDVWGIGRKISSQLEMINVRTALDVARMDPAMVRKRWSVVLERTVRELQGQPCIALENEPQVKQQIACTRSFGHPVQDLQGLIQAVSEFASRASEKLRNQHSVANAVMVFIQTSPYRPDDPQYAKSLTIELNRPSSSALDIVGAAICGLEVIFREGYRYAKAGVMLLDISPEGVEQGELDLFGDTEARIQSTKLMSAMDAINAKFGKGSLKVASAGARNLSSAWQMKQELRTPQYTTRLLDLPVVFAD